MPGPSIGDVWLALQLQGAEFQASAKKEGGKAGEAAGQAMAIGIQAKLSNLFKTSIFAGAGIEIGRQALVGLEGAISGVIDAIPNMIHQGEAFALTVDDIADKTGASAQTASLFASTLNYLGISTSGLGTSLKTLSAEIVTNEDKFAKLGIQTRDSNGNLLDTITILNNVRTYLSGAGDGATKMALAADLLGRSAGDLIDFLNLTDEQAAGLGKTLKDTGQVIDETTRHNAESLARETNLLSGVWQGFANMLFTEVAPTIRAVIGGITEFIKVHGAEIRATIVSMTQAVLGFIEGLLGLSGVTPFQAQLDSLGGSATNVTLSFEQWAQQTGHTIPTQDKLKVSTKGATDAIDRQIASTQKAIDVEKRRDDASETIFQRTMKRLAGEYQAQLDALDLAEKQIAIADRRRGLNEQLNQAQLELAKAKGAGGGVDAQGVSDAMAKVADIQAQQAENERQLTVASQRDRLQATKDYIDNVAKIEAEADNKKALANTLRLRDEKLTGELVVAQAAKDAPAIADITAKLEAVKTAEERTAAALRSKVKTDELTTLKAQLEAQRQAVAAAGANQVSDNAKTLATLKADYETYKEDIVAKTKNMTERAQQIVAGDPASGTGIGGALTKAFGDGQAAGEEFRKWLDEHLLPALQGIVDVTLAIAGALAEVAKYSDLVGQLGDLVIHAGIATPQVPDVKDINKQVDAFVEQYKYDHSGQEPTEAQVRKYLHDQGVPGMAAGGQMDAHMPYLVGEQRPEIVVPGERSTVIPSIAAAMGGWTAGDQTIEVPVYLDGDVLTRVVSRRQADALRR